MQIGVLASGQGTVLDAIVAAALPVKLVLVDRPCDARRVAENAGVEVIDLWRDDFSDTFDREAYTSELTATLRAHLIDLVVMAGFGTVLAPSLFAAYASRVINTHPSLLPAFPGWHAVRDAIAYGVKVTGCTVHVATAEVDHGPILAQEPVFVALNDDESTLHERIKTVERRLYVQTIQDILERGSVL